MVWCTDAGCMNCWGTSFPFLHFLSLPRQSNAKKRAEKYDCWHFATPRDFQLAAVAAETHPAKAGIGEKKKEKPASTTTTSKRLNVFDFAPPQHFPWFRGLAVAGAVRRARNSTVR